MKQMQREGAASKARRAERKADEKSGLVSLKPVKMEIKGTGGGGGGFKKGGFKNAFAAAEDGPAEAEVVKSVETRAVKENDGRVEESGGLGEDEESDLEDGGEDAYDPRRPTDCHPGCPGYVS